MIRFARRLRHPLLNFVSPFLRTDAPPKCNSSYGSSSSTRTPLCATTIRASAGAAGGGAAPPCQITKGSASSGP